jgi:hypothetical protein
METGREQMERSFRNLLTRSSSPVTANTLLDILNAGEGIASLSNLYKFIAAHRLL